MVGRQPCRPAAMKKADRHKKALPNIVAGLLSGRTVRASGGPVQSQARAFTRLDRREMVRAAVFLW